MANAPKSLESQMYGDDKKLSHAGMKVALANGHSVMTRNGVITHPDNLPTPGQIAKGNKTKEDAARASLLAQRAALDAQLAELEPQAPEKGLTTEQKAALSPIPSLVGGGGTLVGPAVPGKGDTAGKGEKDK